MFRRATELDLKKACHADEWVHHSNQEPNFRKDLPLLLKNAWTAVFNLQIDRGEHFRSLAYDHELTKIIIDKSIAITGCPSSYITSELLPNNDVRHLMLRELLDKGVLYSINPDDDLFMEDVHETFERCDDAYHFTQDEKTKLRMNAWNSRFGRRKPLT